jgi:hypothetical protein
LSPAGISVNSRIVWHFALTSSIDRLTQAA